MARSKRDKAGDDAEKVYFLPLPLNSYSLDDTLFE